MKLKVEHVVGRTRVFAGWWNLKERNSPIDSKDKEVKKETSLGIKRSATELVKSAGQQRMFKAVQNDKIAKLGVNVDYNIHEQKEM